MSDHVSPTARTILVVEDDALIAMDFQAELEAAGWRVLGPVGRVAAALDLLSNGRPQAAVLDINLGRETSYPVASALVGRGVPFVFLSGDTADSLPAEFSQCRILAKPIRYDGLRAALDTAVPA
jgi:DNA-binding response OmpR family regulator